MNTDGNQLAIGSAKIESVKNSDPPQGDFKVDAIQEELTIEYDQDKYPIENITVNEENNLSIITPVIRRSLAPTSVKFYVDNICP